MKLGFGLPVSSTWATRENIVHFATQAETLGYDSQWTFHRLLYPVSGTMPPQYRDVLDPITVLSHVAALTTRCRLGVAVLNAPFQTPIVLAKQLTALDILSDGRLLAGFGIGWSDEEFVAVNVPKTKRAARTTEFLECLREIWTADEVEFHGEFYQVPRSYVWPKPVQKPHPPILLGAIVPAALKRIGRTGDGWISGSNQDLRMLGEHMEIVRQAAREAGRDPSVMQFISRGRVSISDAGAKDGAERKLLHGTVTQIRADLAQLEEVGITELFFDLNFDAETAAEDADPADSVKRATEVLQTYAPKP